ncbi:MAG: class I SAM-dependent methyltransferase [Chloroflexi bacterium]|nr:class I SAM-dependent methyltransferase [Chloroflexota bacterium]
MSDYDRIVQWYIEGNVPWDEKMPPPEVAAWTAVLPPGKALDLGCGYGRSAIYLAQRGWRVDGVDFVSQAIAEARKRAQKSGVPDKICFHAASVAELDFLAPSYDLALDIGCMHNLDAAALCAYADGLRRLLRSEASYLLYARLRQLNEAVESGPRGLPEEQIRALFAEGFVLEKVERGETAVPDQPIWPSAWFYFRRQ